MINKNVRITIHKELRGVFRDKKSLHRLLLLPLLIPFIVLLFGFLFDFMSESTYKVGIDYELSSDEKEIIKEYDNLEFVSYKNIDELKEAYDAGEISGYISKTDNKYTIYYDPTVNSGETVDYYSNMYLQEYGQKLANDFLISQNINPELVFNNIVIEDESLSKTDESNSMFTVLLSLTITYVLMIVVMACVTVATDATSGEKERGTLETILTFPVNSSDFVAGKYLATAILGLIVGLFAYMLTIPSILIGKQLFDSFAEVNINANIGTMFLVLIIVVVASLLSAGICIALAGKAKTYKEAQSSLQYITFLPMIPYFVKIMEVDNSFFSLVPISNCGMALNDITMNNFNLTSFIIMLVSTIIYIVLIVLYISKQYSKEETLFS